MTDSLGEIDVYERSATACDDFDQLHLSEFDPDGLPKLDAIHQRNRKSWGAWNILTPEQIQERQERLMADGCGDPEIVNKKQCGGGGR